MYSNVLRKAPAVYTLLGSKLLEGYARLTPIIFSVQAQTSAISFGSRDNALETETGLWPTQSWKD